MDGELEKLKDILRSEEITLSQYAHNLGTGDRILEANYHHKKAQVEALRARIAQMEQKKKE